MAKLLYLCLFIVMPLMIADGTNPTWSEKSLIKDLLQDYEKRARPVVDGVSKVVEVGEARVQQITVEFGLALIQILQLNENEQILTVSVKSLYRWPDHHLIWNPEDYENITYITIPTSKIWIPDIALYNYADERLEERRECAARVNHNGTIEWHPMAIYKSTCPVKIKYFPYDRQTCTLRFGPWTYDSARVNTTFYDSKFDLEDYIESPEWILLKHRADWKQRKYACCPEIYTDMLFQIVIERQPAYYNYLLILPCFLLSSLTLVLFWLPPETPAKMVLGMNIFLAFFLLLLLLEGSIPSASSSFPLIGNYYCINMTLVTVSTFLCLIVVNIHFRGDRQTEVPPWLRKLAIQHGARFLLVNVNNPKPVSGSPGKKPGKYETSTAAAAKDGDGMLSGRSQPSYYPGAGMHFSDIPPYPHLRFPPATQSLPYAQRFQYPNDYLGTLRTDQNPPSQGYPKISPMSPYNPTIDYSSLRTGYHDRNYPHSSYQEWIEKQANLEDSTRVCSFCPACAGLAAAAAVTSATREDNEASDDLSVEQHKYGLTENFQPSEFVHPPMVPPQPYVQDPTEQLAAVWAAAMTGSAYQGDKHTGATAMYGQTNQTGAAEDEDEDDENDEDNEEPMNSFTSARNRSIGPELECFLLECIRPQSTKRSINAANARWSEGHEGLSKHRPDVPPSPFYKFRSPYCKDEDDDSSENEWAVDRGCAKLDPNLPVEDRDSEEFVEVPGLWRTNSGKSIRKERKAAACEKDKSLLKRVQTVKRDVAEIVRCIRFMQRINENKERINKVIVEWRVVGMVLDRFFFVIYLCALGISIIMYFPRSGDDPEDQI